MDEYEKSVLLTQAQEQLITEFYNGKNPFSESFENTEEIRRYLDQLVTTYTSSTPVTSTDNISSKSKFYDIPLNVWFIVFEAVVLQDEAMGCASGKTVRVRPITHDTYFSLINNPFKRPNKNKVFRLDIKANLVEIISEYNVSSYFIRYVVQPQPIILTDLNDLSVNGVNIKTECELNPVLHRSILQRAVQLALQRFNVSGN